jgi:hypothetical protein
MTEVARAEHGYAAPLDDEVIALAVYLHPCGIGRARLNSCCRRIAIWTVRPLPCPHGDANRNVATWIM